MGLNRVRYFSGLLGLLGVFGLLSEGAAVSINSDQKAQYALTSRTMTAIENGDWDEFKRAMDTISGDDAVVVIFEQAELTLAIRGGNVKILEYMLNYIQEHYSPRFDHRGSVFLEYAINHKNVAAARLFLKTPWLDIAALKKETGKENPLVLAIINDDVDMFKLLDEFGFDFDEVGSSGKAIAEMAGAVLMYGTKVIPKIQAEGRMDGGLYSALRADAVNIVRYIFESRGTKLNFIKRNSYIKDIQVFIQNLPISTKMVEALFAIGISYKDLITFEEKTSLLDRALNYQQEALVEYLLDKQHVRLSDDATELATVIAQGNKTLLERLLKHQIQHDPNWSFGDQSFWETLDTAGLDSESYRGNAVKRIFLDGKIELLRVFCEYAINQQKQPALDALLAMAVEHHEVESVQYLLTLGANPNANVRYPKGKLEPVIAAALGNNQAASLDIIKIADALLAAGADIRYIDQHNGRNLLHELALKAPSTNKNALLTKMLNKKIIDVNLKTKDKKGDTPLAFAALENDAAAIAVLCQYGADPVLLQEGDIDLGYVMQRGYINTAKALVACGHPVDAAMRDTLIWFSDDFPAKEQDAVEIPTNILEIAIKGNDVERFKLFKKHGRVNTQQKKLLFDLALNNSTENMLVAMEAWAKEIIQANAEVDYFDKALHANKEGIGKTLFLLNLDLPSQYAPSKAFWDRLVDNQRGNKSLFSYYVQQKKLNISSDRLVRLYIAHITPGDIAAIHPSIDDLNYLKAMISQYEAKAIQTNLVDSYVSKAADNFKFDDLAQGMAVFNYWLDNHSNNLKAVFTLEWRPQLFRMQDIGIEFQKNPSLFLSLAQVLAKSRLTITYGHEDYLVPLLIKYDQNLAESGKPLALRLTADMCVSAVYKQRFDSAGLKKCFAVSDLKIQPLYDAILATKRSDYLDVALQQSKEIEAKLISELFTVDKFYSVMTDEIRQSLGKITKHNFPIELSTSRVDSQESVYSYLMKRYTSRFFEVYEYDYLIARCDPELLAYLQKTGFVK